MRLAPQGLVLWSSPLWACPFGPLQYPTTTAEIPRARGTNNKRPKRPAHGLELSQPAGRLASQGPEIWRPFRPQFYN
jgi:hypothetical protein